MPRRRPKSYTALEDLGRGRLSRHFFMRDFLWSEIAAMHLRHNVPDDPDLAIAAGTRLATELLDPLVETFGPVAIRSALRSCDLNHYGATEVTPQKCARNEANFAGHIWDRRDAKGRMGACASVVVPWFADQYAQGRDWRDLAWWLHDTLDYHEIMFFPKLAAFNITWREEPGRRVSGYMPHMRVLKRAHEDPAEPFESREKRYADFPPFRGIPYPDIPERWAA